MFKSINNGGSWSQFGESFSNEVLDITLSGDHVFVVTESQNIYRSSKTIGNWTSPQWGTWSQNRLYIGDGFVYAALHRETNVIFSSIESPSWSNLTTNDIYGSSYGSNLNDFRGVYLITGNDPSDTYDDYIFVGTDAIWEIADSREDTFAIMAAKADGTSSDWILLGDTGLAGPPSILQFTNSSQFESLFQELHSIPWMSGIVTTEPGMIYLML